MSSHTLTMQTAKAFLIDGTAFCYRAFHALPNLSTTDGRPTNAVYGFAVMLQALRDKEQPDYLAVAFDVGKPTFRHRKYQEYKVQRKPMPDALIAQIPLIKSLLNAYRIPFFEFEGYEGEDVLATIAKRIATSGVEVFLVTGDKDALQLVNTHIKVYNPHQGEAVVDAQAVHKRYGVLPEQMVDLMALMGDEIDHIPGVPGIGEKIAAKLLQRFGSLQELYDHLEEVESAAQRERLSAAQGKAELSRELARVNSEVPLNVTLKDLVIHEPDWKTLRRMFRDLAFKRLLDALETEDSAVPRRAVKVHSIVHEAELDGLLNALATSTTPVALTASPSGTPGTSTVFTIATGPEEAWVVPVDPARLKRPAGKRLAQWFADPSAQKLGHDLKAVHRTLGALDVELLGVVGDTLLAAYLLNPSRTNQRLSDLTDDYLDERLPGVPPLDGVVGLAPDQPKKQDASYGRVGTGLEASERLEACGQHACAILRLHERLAPLLRDHELEPLYHEVELPLITVLAEMERTGIAIDLPYLERLRATMGTRLSHITEELYRLAGTTFNLNSPKQLAQILFEQLNLPIVKRTKTGPSTDADVLRQLAPQHPLPRRLIEYRELSKLVSTYVDALPKLVDPSTGRIHTSFNQTATATGRLSSSDPNLQNIPVKTELGRQIRKAFVPGGHEGLFVAVDYSQIELRILAHLSKDATLRDAFLQNRDIHRFTASLIYGLPEAEVQPEQRNAMKAINYGILYGMSAHGLAKELEIPYEEAQSFIEAYFERYSKVRGYLDEQIEQAQTSGFVQTLLGRRRYIPELRSADPVVRQFGERMAVNAPIQGSAADLMKRAMLEVSARLRVQRLTSRIILQVHDELLFEVPRDERQALIDLVRPTMEHVLPLDVPLTVTVKVGPNWLELCEVA